MRIGTHIRVRSVCDTKQRYGRVAEGKHIYEADLEHAYVMDSNEDIESGHMRIERLTDISRD
jgi:hypothetical protein